MTLKIQRAQARIWLIGQFRIEHLDQVNREIERCGSPVVLDLEELDLVDVEGIRFLNACEAKGISVLHCSPYIRGWMSRERSSEARTQREKESVMAILTNSPIKTQVRRIDGLSIRYAESEDRDVSAILLSPWPESLFTFEQMWPRLAEHAHLVAIDLPGFGHSERRNELLTSSAMGEFVANVVEEFGLRRPHAVGPDIGTSALLFTAAKHPGLLRSIVVGNGTAAVPIQIGSVLKDVVEAPSLDAFRNVDPRKGVESVLAFVERYKLPDHVREDFLSSYEGDRFVESLRFVRSYPTELPVLDKLLPTIETPVQIITGDHDPGVLPVNGEYLHKRLPHSKSEKVDAGHFAWADAADEYATLIIDWWNGSYERV